MYRSALSILWVFKAWEGSSRLCWGAIRLPVQQSAATSSGYPLVGCSSAELASISPDMFLYKLLTEMSILSK